MHSNRQQERTKPRRRRAEDMLDWFEYGIFCQDRAWMADMRAMRHGSSITGDRERATAERWSAKAEEAHDVVREYLRPSKGLD